MSVNLYDESITNLFRTLFDDNRIHIWPTELVFNLTAQLQKDKVKFPLINLTRLGYNIRGNDGQWVQINKGIPHHRTAVNTNVFHAAVPIRIDYQVDIYAVDRKTCDDITRELIIYIFQNPTLQIQVPYHINAPAVFNIWLNDEIVDNSDISNHFNSGVLYRNTLSLYTDDAYLFSGIIEKQPKIIADVSEEMKPNV